MNLVKAHAFGNDFLLFEAVEVAGSRDRAGVRAERVRAAPWHRRRRSDHLRTERCRARPCGSSTRMAARSEISGNGVRCLAAWIAARRGVSRPDTSSTIDTDAGPKSLELLETAAACYTFRAAMGQPEHVEAGRPRRGRRSA